MDLEHLGSSLGFVGLGGFGVQGLGGVRASGLLSRLPKVKGAFRRNSFPNRSYLGFRV